MHQKLRKFLNLYSFQTELSGCKFYSSGDKDVPNFRVFDHKNDGVMRV